MEWTGPEGLRPLLVPIVELQPHPRNPRRGNVDEIAASLTRFGQARPILTDGTYIVAGNHTYRAAVQLGWTHVAVVAHAFRDEAEVRAYLLADNRLSDLGDYERSELTALLEELSATGAWEGTGFMIDDLEDLHAQLDGVPEMAPEEFRGDFAASPEELAARAERLAGGNTYRELVLLLDGDRNAAFESHLRILKKEYGDSGISELVARAVAEQASRP